MRLSNQEEAPKATEECGPSSCHRQRGASRCNSPEECSSDSLLLRESSMVAAPQACSRDKTEQEDVGCVTVSSATKLMEGWDSFYQDPGL